jgi:hypothetical protein
MILDPYILDIVSKDPFPPGFAPRPVGKMEKKNVQIEQGLLEQFEKARKALGWTLQEAINDAVRLWVEEKQKAKK